MTALKRNLRPRPPGQYISQQEWLLGAQDEDDFILGRRYNVLEKFSKDEYLMDHGFVKEMEGKDFTMKYVQETGLKQPMVFRNPNGLGMRMPSAQLSVADIKKLVGSRRKVDVIDTLTQESLNMTLGQWSKYYETFPRQRILNIISLEFSCTKLDPCVEAPQLVRQLDWVEKVWPVELKNLQTNPTNDLNKMMYPKVQKYCLMSVAGCYTDFHIDFGGTSVWYHVLRGEKQFLLIPPTSKSYSLFQHWQMSGEQEGVFLAELVGKAQLVRLQAGDTFVMPSGWIHAVYTPIDSVVFGGNFLHSFNIVQQLTVAELEQETKVPLRLQYPFYGSIHWYVLWNYMKELDKLATKGQARSDVSPVKSPGYSGRWLKEISMAKLAIVSSENHTSRGSFATYIGKGGPQHCARHENGKIHSPTSEESTAEPTREPEGNIVGVSTTEPTREPEGNVVGVSTAEPTREPEGNVERVCTAEPTKEPEGNMEGVSTTKESEGSMEGVSTTEPTKEPEGSIEGVCTAELTREPKGNMEGVSTTKESEVSMEGVSTTKESEGNMEGVSTTRKPEGSMEGVSTTKESEGSMEGVSTTREPEGSMEGVSTVEPTREPKGMLKNGVVLPVEQFNLCSEANTQCHSDSSHNSGRRTAPELKACTPPRGGLPDDLPKPHLSSYERGGLLLLINKMKNSLFEHQAPSSVSSPDTLISTLEQLLQIAIPQDVYSFEPSGVGVLNSSVDRPLHNHRKRDAAMSPASEKHAKIELPPKDIPIFPAGNLLIRDTHGVQHVHTSTEKSHTPSLHPGPISLHEGPLTPTPHSVKVINFSPALSTSSFMPPWSAQVDPDQMWEGMEVMNALSPSLLHVGMDFQEANIITIPNPAALLS